MADYPTIPITLPLNEKGGNYQVVRTEMDMGYIQTRAKVTKAPRTWTFSHNLCTNAEKLAWLSFWNSKKGGAQVFTFVEPIGGTTVNVRFRMEEYEIERTVWGRYNIGVTLEEAL